MHCKLGKNKSVTGTSLIACDRACHWSFLFNKSGSGKLQIHGFIGPQKVIYNLNAKKMGERGIYSVLDCFEPYDNIRSATLVFACLFV